MDAVFEAAATRGWPAESLHRELFVVPDTPDRPNHPFTLLLAASSRSVAVGADQSAAEALQAAGIAVDVKCSDGICGVCSAGVLAGDVDHRDHVLSARERTTKMLLCCSRAAAPGAEISISL